MNIIEEGVLLLCCRLGERNVKPLTIAQYRELGLRVTGSLYGGNHLAQLHTQDLCRIGYSRADAERILNLLDRRQQMEDYLAKGQDLGIVPVTRVSASYPSRFIKQFGASRPPLLFAMGDLSLLEQPCIAVVGSRELRPDNEAFARQIGRCIAQEGYVLVSGGAKGADSAAQQACLEAGGRCVIFLPDRLDVRREEKNVLYMSADGYDLPFSSYRALHRNTLIHSLAIKAFACQTSFGRGGTWQGCTENLKHSWSDLFVYKDGSEGMMALADRGATAVEHVPSIRLLQSSQSSLFDQA